MKTVLCYGDSLTWGMNAATLSRHAYEDQWPSVLGAGLGEGARVVNAGLGGRTTMFDDHATTADRNGVRILPTVLAMVDPVDLVILMLGTNDLKPFTGGSIVAAAQGIKRLVEIARTFPYEARRPAPEILIVAPPLVLQNGPTPEMPLLSPRVPDSGQFAPVYRQLAASLGAEFFDAGEVATAEGGGDGVHLDARNTRAIGSALVPLVAKLLDLDIARAA